MDDTIDAWRRRVAIVRLREQEPPKPAAPWALPAPGSVPKRRGFRTLSRCNSCNADAPPMRVRMIDRMIAATLSW